MSDGAARLEDAREVARFGGKAVQLGAAARAGLRVPAGVALSWDLVDAVARAESGAHDALRLAIRAFDGPVAVRSSAVGEDSASASFAGVHLTTLNVRGADAVIAAVRATRESGRTESAMAYRRARGLDPEPRVAVVVQALVDAHRAGVLFTRHPVTGADELVIEGSWGLGEAVVGGLVTPDHHRVARDGRVLETRVGFKEIALRRHDDGGTREEPIEPALHEARCLGDADLRALAELASACEAFASGPLDIEWALESGGAPWLLQQRPMTALS